MDRRLPSSTDAAPPTGPRTSQRRSGCHGHHTRARTDKVNNGKITLRHAGTLHSIGIGRTHNGITIKALVNGLNITVIHAHTGQILAQLTLDPTRKYQPQNRQQPEP